MKDNNSPKREYEDRQIGIRTNYGNQRNKTISPWSLKNFDRLHPKSSYIKDMSDYSKYNYALKSKIAKNSQTTNLLQPKQFTDSNL